MLASRSYTALGHVLHKHRALPSVIRSFSDVQEFIPEPRNNRPRQPRSTDGSAPRNPSRPPRDGGGSPSTAPARYDGPRAPAREYGRSSAPGQGGSGRSTRPPTPLKDLRVSRPKNPPHLLTLADLSPEQIADLLRTALCFKILDRPGVREACRGGSIRQSLRGQTAALIFSKRSTRTRVASETSMTMLGGNALFLGKEDIQLGVNETLEDSAKVIGSMVDGIMARVGPHAEVEALVKHSCKPVINALSDLYHPTQILADLLTMFETYSPDIKRTISEVEIDVGRPERALRASIAHIDILAPLKGKKVAWVGDTNNVLNDMLVSFPRLGMTISVASPKGYDKVDERVWKRIEEGGHADKVILTNSPEEALKDADIAVTDTWISMGQEAEKQTRLDAFAGYQITEELCAKAGAKPDWKFMHCLPRKQEEVNDDVFYGKRSLVFPEAENRKWTIMACFEHLIGRWKL